VSVGQGGYPLLVVFIHSKRDEILIIAVPEETAEFLQFVIDEPCQFGFGKRLGFPSNFLLSFE